MLKKIMLMAILGCYAAISVAEISLLCDSCSAQQMETKAIKETPSAGESIVNVISLQPRLIRSYRVIGASSGKTEDKYISPIQTASKTNKALQDTIDYALYIKGMSDVQSSAISGLLTDTVFHLIGSDYHTGNLEYMFQKYINNDFSVKVFYRDGIFPAIKAMLKDDLGVKKFTVKYADGTVAVLQLKSIFTHGVNHEVGVKVEAVEFFAADGSRLSQDKDFYVGHDLNVVPANLPNWKRLLETLGFSWSLKDEGDGYYCWSSDAPNGNSIVRCRHAH